MAEMVKTTENKKKNLRWYKIIITIKSSIEISVKKITTQMSKTAQNIQGELT